MNKSVMIIAPIMLIMGLIAGYWLADSTQPISLPETISANKEILFYRHPMNPEVTSPVPAKDSMGMDYVPVYKNAKNAKLPTGTVEIDGVIVRNISVRTSKAIQSTLSHTIRAVGRLHMMKNAWCIYTLRLKIGLNS